MIGLDTNVVVRLLVDDDPGQVAAARGVLAAALLADETCLVTDAVLCEIEWVLTSCYQAERRDVEAACQALLDRRPIVFESREVVDRALAAFRDGRADLSDCLIGARGLAAGARTSYSFDKRVGAREGFSLLTSAL